MKSDNLFMYNISSSTLYTRNSFFNEQLKVFDILVAFESFDKLFSANSFVEMTKFFL